MKQYFLARFSDLHKWVVSKSQAAKHDGGQNIGPITDYKQAIKERNELNRKIKNNGTKKK